MYMYILYALGRKGVRSRVRHLSQAGAHAQLARRRCDRRSTREAQSSRVHGMDHHLLCFRVYLIFITKLVINTKEFTQCL